MADLAKIRAGLAANLAVLPDVQVNPYWLSNPTPPAIHVFPGQIMFDSTFQRGMDILEFRVQAFIGLTTDIGAQTTLDQYLAGSGALSVKAALEADKTLGGAAFDTRVVSSTGLQQYTGGQAPLLMCEWTVSIYAHG